jgi:hypothetical protein
MTVPAVAVHLDYTATDIRRTHNLVDCHELILVAGTEDVTSTDGFTYRMEISEVREVSPLCIDTTTPAWLGNLYLL